MRRSLATGLLVVVGLVLLLDFVVVNPSLAGLAGGLLQYVVLLAAAAAVAGTIALVVRHAAELRRPRGDRAGSFLVLAGMAVMLVAGFYPGSSGASDPVMRWLVASVFAPLVASVFALLFFFLLAAARRGLRLHSRETTLMVIAASVVLVLLLPLGGALGGWLAAGSTWALSVPIGAVFRGLLIGIAIATAIAAARVILAVDASADE
ncbi:MAG TPA: hypothetical protein VFJ03_01665 [Candidatus Limnocylindria bacterium]|nr:hypothetical protein [Candidatus Limnocylindria bacterium]